jgi:hypothetical protein
MEDIVGFMVGNAYTVVNFFILLFHIGQRTASVTHIVHLPAALTWVVT